MLNENIKAPDFELLDANGNTHTLKQYLGKKVIVYFYPKDDTPGCTKQACSFRENYNIFQSNDIVVIGISKDTVKSHQKFMSKYELPFILLSDPELNVIKAFDVWKEKMLYGKSFLGIIRSTFIINEEGMIEKVYEKVSPDKNVQELIEYLNLK